VRPALPEHYRPIWKAREEAWQDHWGYAPFVEEDYRRWLDSPLFDPALWKVAWEGDRVAGMVLNRIDEAENARQRRRAATRRMSFVLRPWRPWRGAGATYPEHRDVPRSSMDETALGVDTQNPSCALGLYQDIGYGEVHRHTIYRKHME